MTAGVIFRLMVLLISNLGYWELLRRKTKMDPCFWPSAVVAGQVTVLFAAGLLGMLNPGIFVLFGTGIVLFLWFVRTDRDLAFLKNYACVEYLFLALMSVLVLFLVRNRLLAGRDNFTHWATVVRVMLAEGRMPNYLDEVMLYQEYPLGSSLYIVYVSRLLSGGEPILMFAQAYMILAAMMSVFAFCRNHRREGLVYAILLANFLLMYNIEIYELYVDTLLPMAGACAVAYFFCYGRRISEEKWIGLFGSAYLIWVNQIKNSGIFFILICVVLILAGMRKNHAIRTGIVTILMPLASTGLWKLHCKLAYPGAEKAMHSTAVNDMLGEFSGKSGGTVLQVCKSMVRYTFFLRDVWIIFLILAAVTLIAWSMWPEKRKKLLWLFLGAAAIFGAYQISLTAMYLFTMSEENAITLAQVDRYEKVILIALVFLTACLTMAILSGAEGKNRWRSWLAAALILPCTIGCMGGIETVATKERNFSTAGNGKASAIARHQWMADAAAEYDVPEKSSYCVLLKESEGNYFERLGRFLFLSTDMILCDPQTPEELDAIEAPYIFVYDPENPVTAQWIRKNYPGQVGNAVIVRSGETCAD